MKLETNAAYLKYIENLRLALIDIPKPEVDKFIIQYMETVSDQFEDYEKNGKIETIEEFVNSLESPKILSAKLKSDLKFRPTLISNSKKFIFKYVQSSSDKPYITSLSTSMVAILLTFFAFILFSGPPQTNKYTLLLLALPIVLIIVVAALSIYIQKLMEKNSSTFFTLIVGNTMLLVNLVMIIFGINTAYETLNQYGPNFLTGYAQYPNSSFIGLTLNSHLDPYVILAQLLLVSLCFTLIMTLFFIIIKRNELKKSLTILVPLSVIIITILAIMGSGGPYTPNSYFNLKPVDGVYYHFSVDRPGYNGGNDSTAISIPIIGNIKTLNGGFVKVETNKTSATFSYWYNDNQTTYDDTNGSLPINSYPWYWNYTETEWISHANERNGTTGNGVSVIASIKNSVYTETRKNQSGALEIVVNTKENRLLFYNATGTFTNDTNYNAIQIVYSYVYKGPINVDYTWIILTDLLLWATFVSILNGGTYYISKRNH